jgi:hypothetical protein
MNVPLYVQNAKRDDGKTVAEIAGDEQPTIATQPRAPVLEVWRRRLADAQGYHREQNPSVASKLESNASAIIAFLEESKTPTIALFVFTQCRLTVFVDEETQKALIAPD